MPARPLFETAALLVAPWTNSPQENHAPYPGRFRLLVDALQGRAQYGAIQGWRFGRRRPPQWACAMMAAHLRRDAYERLAVADLLHPKEKAPD